VSEAILKVPIGVWKRDLLFFLLAGVERWYGGEVFLGNPGSEATFLDQFFERL
jgi:hypothetical protein